MRRVELIGPPGVGKTTLLKPLHRELARKGVRVASPRWLPLWAYHDREQTGKRRRRLEAALYRLKGVQRWMRPKLEKEMVREEFRELREAEAPWPEFLQFGLRRDPDAAVAPALVLERIRSFISSVAEARAADRLPGKTAVLFDEGLAQRAVSLGQANGEDGMREYFRLMPEPAAVVLVAAPPEVVQERLRRRNPNVTRFHEMVEQALGICEVAEAVSGQRGIHVVRADVSEPAEGVAKGVAKAVRDALSGKAAP